MVRTVRMRVTRGWVEFRLDNAEREERESVMTNIVCGWMGGRERGWFEGTAG